MDEPGTFIFEWCCQRCRPRPPHGPAAGPAIRPQPGRVSPGVTRRPRAVRSGQPLRAVRPKFLSASATCRLSFERTVRAKGASLSRRRPMTRWRECSRTAAKALRRRLTEPGVMCYKSLGGCWRRPSSGRGHGQGLSVSRRAESILARRTTSRAICLQKRMTSRIFSTTAVGDFKSAQSHPWVVVLLREACPCWHRPQPHATPL